MCRKCLYSGGREKRQQRRAAEKGWGMVDLVHCQRCRRVFVRTAKNICPQCLYEIEQEFLRCHDFLRDHPGSTVMEIHEGTGVSVKQIEEFVKEGRFEFVSGGNLDYGCERCGRRIRKGRFCDQCQQELMREFSQLMDEKKEFPEAPRPAGPSKGSVIWERRQQQLDD